MDAQPLSDLRALLARQLAAVCLKSDLPWWSGTAIAQLRPPPAADKIVVRGYVDVFVCRDVTPRLAVVATSSAALASIKTTASARKRVPGRKLVIDAEGDVATSTLTMGPFGSIKMVATGNHCVQIGHMTGDVTLIAGGRRATPVAQPPAQRATVVLALPEVPRLECQVGSVATLLDVRQDALRISVEGTSTILAFGSVGQLDATATDAGNVLAGQLDAGEVDLVAKGTARIVARSTRSPHARASGVGRIDVMGRPAEQVVRNSSSGMVRFL